MRFEKISREQWNKDLGGHDGRYEDIILPYRATQYSAGYDFFAPFDIILCPGETITVPTGIRVILDPDKYLGIYPRSGLGFNFRLRLNNTVGIVDADYSESDNEGHIFIKLSNEGDKPLEIPKGKGIAQGIINNYNLVENDTAINKRNGGFGSTSK